MSSQSLFQQGMTLHRAGKFADAEAIYRRILAIETTNVDVMQMLGVLASQTGRFAMAEQLLRQAAGIAPRIAGIQNNLGLALLNQKKFADAETAFERAIELQPASPEAHNNLGTCLRYQGKLGRAVETYRKALSLRDVYPEALNNLGAALRDQDRNSEAITSFRQAVLQRPEYVDAIENLGHALRVDGQLDEAIASYRHALALRPNAGTLSALGNTLKDAGLLQEAIDCYRQSLTMRPDARTGSNLLYTLHFATDNPAEIWAEHILWREAFAKPVTPTRVTFVNDRSPDRRLRIGYVSPDFRGHCQAFFTLPVLRNHDRKSFEIFCYSNAEKSDATTDLIRVNIDGWRDIAGLDDDAAADMIRQDKIDILVDLTLHMDRSRLLVFARKPAPVQITWLGYPGTTAVPAMDYRLSDPIIDPTDADQPYYSEQTIRLPETWWCYDPLTTGPALESLPALRNGFITFGCLNNFCKVTPRTLALWARVLQAIPTARLLLLAPQGSARNRVLALLAAGGVDAHRVEFTSTRPRNDYLALFNRIDIGLDPVPCPGHTTTLDALYMGVPVVHLPGGTAISRGGASILHAAGLDEWIASSADDFVARAIRHAQNLPALAALRLGLRSQLRRSPLMDAPRFTRHLESAFRELWQRWCGSELGSNSVDFS